MSAAPGQIRSRQPAPTFRAAEEPLQQALRLSAVGIGVIDGAGTLEDANPAFLALAGAAPGEARLPVAITGLLEARLTPAGRRALAGALAGASRAMLECTAGGHLDFAIEDAGEAGRLVTLRRAVAPDPGSLAERAESRLDPLTGLGNRRAYADRVEECRRAGEGMTLILIDLDHFKSVNDTLGHETGDHLLKLVGRRLRGAPVGEGSLVVRLGGDEFAILQPGRTDQEATLAAALRLIDLLRGSYLVDGQIITIGATAGIAFAAGAEETEHLLRRADLALYDAKAEGRGTARIFRKDLEERAAERRRLEMDLRRALAMREFSLVYQPQLDLSSNRLVGFEALLRWRHPERGMVPPSLFIPLAEEIGIIAAIGEWVLRTACAEARKWPEEISVAVNVSALQITGEGFVAAVLSALATTGLAPQRLELEITESAFLADTALTVERLNQLKAIGVNIAMDDFGTGYSSLSYLNSFPFSKIKIDQSFVRGNNRQERTSEVVKAIAALGQSLGMATIAEGVETAEQLAWISEVGCTNAQGYFVSRPVPPEAVDALIAGHGGERT